VTIQVALSFYISTHQTDHTKDCDYRHGNPGQRWSLVGAQIRASDTKCLDVRDGSTANGAKLQIWACGSTNANQRFAHSGGDVLTIPDDRISWATHPGKCVDLTGGRLSNGNQVGAEDVCVASWMSLTLCLRVAPDVELRCEQPEPGKR
jgi:hypothetical protein